MMYWERLPPYWVPEDYRQRVGHPADGHRSQERYPFVAFGRINPTATMGYGKHRSTGNIRYSETLPHSTLEAYDCEFIHRATTATSSVQPGRGCLPVVHQCPCCRLWHRRGNDPRAADRRSRHDQPCRTASVRWHRPDCAHHFFFRALLWTVGGVGSGFRSAIASARLVLSR